MVALLDLNPNTLHITTAPLADRGITAAAHTGSVLAPLPTDIGVFDSVSTNFVLHCVPGTWAEKGRAFAHIVPVTADDGVTSARPCAPHASSRASVGVCCPLHLRPRATFAYAGPHKLCRTRRKGRASERDVAVQVQYVVRVR